MPRKSTIAPVKVGPKFRVIIPKDLREDPGTRQTKWFNSKTKADEYCAQLNHMRGEIGVAFYHLDRVDQSRVIQALHEAGDAATLLEYVKLAKTIHPKDTATLNELAVRAVAAKEKAGNSGVYTNRLKNALKAFMRDREAMLAHEVQPHHIEEWLNSNPEWTPETRRTYLRSVHTMFSFGIRNNLVLKNPAANVEKPRMGNNPPAILRWQECERFMRAAANHDPALVQYLALCLFGGLRPSEAFRLQAENIKADVIEVYPRKTRNRSRRLVPINPTLKAWLAAYPGDFGPVNLHRRLVRATKCGKSIRDIVAEDGGLPIHYPQDWMRHTFVSNYYPIHGPKETALAAGHSESVLFQHYRELVTREDAERFWGILPL
jgi:integrase